MKNICFILLSLFLLVSCEDSSEGDIGKALRSEDDNILSAVDTFHLATETCATDAFYADNASFYVGNYTNEKYGALTGSVIAQVINPSRSSFKDIFEYKSEVALKEAGKLRIEGKNYVMQDGDCVFFKFNV